MFVPAPTDLRPWLDGGVVVRSDARLPATRFPALVGSMLVVRVAGDVFVPRTSGAIVTAAESRRVPAHDRPGAGVPDLLPMSAFIGPSTGATHYRHAGAVHAVGVLVRPEAVPVLLRASAAACADARIAFGDALGGQTRRGAGNGWAMVEDAVCTATDDSARLALLFDAVRIAVDGARHDARRRMLMQLRAAVERMPVTEAARALGWSTRQFERRFFDGFGLRPKQFQVIARMQAAMHAALRHGGTDAHRAQGARIAAEHGYFDQAHLARDLRRLAGAPLRDLIRYGGEPGASTAPDAAARIEHWPLTVGRTIAHATQK